MENGEWNRMEESLPRCLDTCSFKDKIAKTKNKTRRKTKRHEGNYKLGRGGTHGRASTTTGRGGSHSQPMVASSRSSLGRFSDAALCALSGPRALPMLGHFGPLFAIFFDPVDRKKYLLITCV